LLRIIEFSHCAPANGLVLTRPGRHICLATTLTPPPPARSTEPQAEPSTAPHSDPPTYMPRGVPRARAMQDAANLPDAPRGLVADHGNGPAGLPTLPPDTDSITIKNHFPVARIKRIMQADDDVGKVAQVTPVVVCKARSLPVPRVERLTRRQPKHSSSS